MSVGTSVAIGKFAVAPGRKLYKIEVLPEPYRMPRTMRDENTLIPSPTQLSAWRQEVRQRFPHFQLIFEVRKTDLGWVYDLHFHPLPGAPLVRVGPCFRQKPSWYPLELLWRDYGGSELDFIFSLYPDEASLGEQAMSLPGLPSVWPAWIIVVAASAAVLGAASVLQATEALLSGDSLLAAACLFSLLGSTMTLLATGICLRAEWSRSEIRTTRISASVPQWSVYSGPSVRDPGQ